MNFMQRIFNYRLSRARRVIENIFGILTNKFRVFERTMQLDASKVKKVTLAACVLHNFLIDVKNPEYTAEIENLQAENPEMVNEVPNDANENIGDANEIRNRLMEWFLMPGAGEVDFQYTAII